MKDETKNWLKYSKENLHSAIILLESELFNPCLQNIQQSVEKALKAIIIEKSLSFKKTHSILELKYMLSNDGINIDLPDEECEFLDSVYLPSKYPIMSVLPEFDPDFNICKNGIEIAKQVISLVEKIVQSED